MEHFFLDTAPQDFWLLREGIHMRITYDDSGSWFVDTKPDSKIYSQRGGAHAQHGGLAKKRKETESYIIKS